MCTAERLREQDGLINWVKTTCWGLLLATLVYFPPISYAQMKIYSNDPLSTGPIAEDGTAAPAGYTWSELQHDAGNATEANAQFGHSAISGIQSLADDFIVPKGELWTISTVVFYAYKTNAPAMPSPFNAYYLKVWSGRPGDADSTVLCGDAATNVLSTSTDSLMFRIQNSAVPSPGVAPGTTRKIWRNTVTIPTGCSGKGFFTPGSYWLEWSSETNNSPGSPNFHPATTPQGVRSIAGNNARGFVNMTALWFDVVDTGLPSTAADVFVDFPFEIYGTVDPIDRIFADGFE